MNMTREIELIDPYTTPYKGIYAICDANNDKVEIIEHSTCYGGAAWSKFHYAHSPLILKTRSIGNIIRYLAKSGTSHLNLKPSRAAAGIESIIIDEDEVHITYVGLGGGGVGATKCRAYSSGVLNYNITSCGGGKEAKGTVVVPKRQRILIGIDDTDSKEEGATWTLTHNIAKYLNCDDSVYLSHTLVQLFPVSARTQNCVSTVLEFGCLNDEVAEELIQNIKAALKKYSASHETGMVVYRQFSASDLYPYSKACRNTELSKEYALTYALEHNVEIHLDGNGIIGALASLAWFSRPDESVIMDAEINDLW